MNIAAASSRAPPNRGPIVSRPEQREETRSLPVCVILFYKKNSLRMCISMRVYKYVYVCMYVCVFVCMYVYMYVRMYICMYVYMYICMYVCVYVY
jgi:hypothetical protein